MTTALRSIRFPVELAAALEKASTEAGMSFNAYVIEVLRAHLHSADPRESYLAALREWLLATYSRDAFPPEVTRLVFKHILDTPALRQDYDALVRNREGRPDGRLRADLHKEIGRMVKQALQAEVCGRVVDLDPAEHLVGSHALLRPTASKGEELRTKPARNKENRHE